MHPERVLDSLRFLRAIRATVEVSRKTFAVFAGNVIVDCRRAGMLHGCRGGFGPA